MATTTISGAGAHALAALTDRIPATKAGVKGYLTPSQIIGDLGVTRLLAISGSAVSVGATTAETVLATIAVGANLLGANGFLIVETSWLMTNNANAKTATVKFGASGAGTGGTIMQAVSVASGASWRGNCTIQNANSVSSQIGGAASSLIWSTGPAGVAPPTAAINTAAASEIVITGTKGTSGDTLTLNFYRVFICYGA